MRGRSDKLKQSELQFLNSGRLSSCNPDAFLSQVAQRSLQVWNLYNSYGYHKRHRNLTHLTHPKWFDTEPVDIQNCLRKRGLKLETYLLGSQGPTHVVWVLSFVLANFQTILCSLKLKQAFQRKSFFALIPWCKGWGRGAPLTFWDEIIPYLKLPHYSVLEKVNHA